MKRFISILLVLMMLLTMTACGDKKDNAGTIKEGLCYEATGISPDAVAVTVDGNELPMDIYYYLINESSIYMAQFMAQYGKEMDWTTPFGDTTAEEVVRAQTQLSATQMLAIENMANKHRVTLDEVTLGVMEEQRTAAIEEVGGEEIYQQLIAQMGLREESYERIRRNDYLQMALQEFYLTEGSTLYPSQEELAAYAEEIGYMSADHILFGTIDLSTRQKLSDEVIAEKRAKAEKVLAELRAYDGDDLNAFFTEMGNKHSEDTGRLLNPEGYTFGPNQMVEEFENGTKALAPGEVSDIIESDFGFHIILRKELDTALAANAVQGNYFVELINRETSSAQVEINEKLAALDIPTIHEAFLAAQSGPETEDSAEEESGADTPAVGEESSEEVSG